MSKQRYLNTKFWSDTWISNLDPIEKLLYLYILTNERTNIAGVYELPIKIMSVETGIEKEMVEKIFSRFEEDNKVIYRNGWIYIKNFIKHQDIKNEKIKKGIELVLLDIPEDIKDSLSIAYPYPLNYINTNNNTNNNSIASEKSDATDSSIKKSKTHELVDYFFVLKGWDDMPTEFYKENKISYPRCCKDAKELLTLVNDDLEEAKRILDKSKDKFNYCPDEWLISTAIKRYLEL